MPPVEVLDQRDDADGHTHNHSDVHLGVHSTTVVVIVVTVHLLCEGAVTYRVSVWWAYKSVARIFWKRGHNLSAAHRRNFDWKPRLLIMMSQLTSLFSCVWPDVLFA